MRLTEQDLKKMQYDEGYQMGVQETAYLIFKDLYGTCPHIDNDLGGDGVTNCFCHACDRCMKEIKKRWLNE